MRPLAASKAGAGGSHERLQEEWVGGFGRGEGKRARDSYSGVVSLAGTAQVAHCVECVGSYGSLHWPPRHPPARSNC